MALTKALGDANAAKSGASMDENSGPDEVGMLGYVQIPFPSQMPARSNSEISITKNMSISAQQGTSLPSYSDQSEKVNAETGN